MKWLIGLILIFGISGCNSVQTKDILADLSHCKRHYTGAVAIGTAGISDNATFTVQIDCDPVNPTTPVPTTP